MNEFNPFNAKGEIPGGGDAALSKRSWTYMVYMGADNNLSTAGLYDLKEMETVGSDKNINIVLQAEFSTEFTPFDDPEFGHTSYQGETIRMRVKKNNDPDDVNLEAGVSIGHLNMASPDTLKDFIVWATKYYPADHYALVIWDHGAGWEVSSLTKGAVEDATSDSFMTLPDLAKGVRDAGVHLDLINFDACLMAMYEVAYEFSGLCDYMAFSEEVEPGDGDPYDTILAALASDPDMTPAGLSETIVDKFVEYYQIFSRDDDVTKSAIAMSGIGSLHVAIQELADALTDDYPAVSSAVEFARANSQNYQYRTNYDLYAFCESLAGQYPEGSVRDKAQAVMDIIESSGLIVKNAASGSSVTDSRGLAIFAPGANQISADEKVNELSTYAELACNQDRSTGWYKAVKAMMEEETENLVPGDFAFYIKWDTDADLDLYVREPDGNFYAPWCGNTTPNGYFSADSGDTGLSEEYYNANDYVKPGQYDVLINYYEDGSSSATSTTAKLFYREPGSSEWQETGPLILDLSDPYLGDFTDLSGLEELNGFSNWSYPAHLNRASAGKLQINTGKGEITIQFRWKKTKPSLFNLGGES